MTNSKSCPFFNQTEFILNKKIYFSGVLRELDAPGHFEQQLYFYGIPMPSVDYNVIYIDEEVHIDPEFKNSRLIIFNQNLGRIDFNVFQF